eukprot:1008666-Pleurochrysis_carterae.AAC.1
MMAHTVAMSAMPPTAAPLSPTLICMLALVAVADGFASFTSAGPPPIFDSSLTRGSTWCWTLHESCAPIDTHLQAHFLLDCRLYSWLAGA